MAEYDVEATGALPETLWHYTTAANLFRILNSTALFATSFQQLSDASEIAHAHSLLTEFLRDDLRRRVNPSGAQEAAEQETLRWLEGWLQGVIALPSVADDSDIDREGIVGIFSLSEHGDQLSQWRGYGGSAGVAIGFNRERLVEALRSFDAATSLRKCVYKKEEARRVFEPLRNLVLDELIRTGQIEAFHGRMLFFALAPQVKHRGFREEAEWRIITGRRRPSSCLLRPAGDRVTSYVPLELVKKLENEEAIPWVRVVSEVRIGPARHGDVTHKALEPVLRRNYMMNVSVSEIPFRAL